MFKKIKKWWKKKPKIENIRCFYDIDYQGNIIFNLRERNDIFQHVRYTLRLDSLQWKYIGLRKGFKPNVYTTNNTFWKIFLNLENCNKITRDEIINSYHKLAKIYHPDKPTGSTDLMKMLNRAKSDALAEIGDK